MDDLRKPQNEDETPSDIVFLDKAINFLFQWSNLKWVAIGMVLLMPHTTAEIFLWWYDNFVLTILNNL